MFDSPGDEPVKSSFLSACSLECLGPESVGVDGAPYLVHVVTPADRDTDDSANVKANAADHNVMEPGTLTNSCSTGMTMPVMLEALVLATTCHVRCSRGLVLPPNDNNSFVYLPKSDSIDYIDLDYVEQLCQTAVPNGRAIRPLTADDEQCVTVASTARRNCMSHTVTEAPSAVS